MKKVSGLFSNIKGDLFGGITAGIVALPLALAFGEQTELGAIAGLYGAIALGILASVFGGTKVQISGPTAPMTVVSAVMIIEVIKITGSLEKAMPVIVAAFVLTGLIQVLLGVLKVGKYIKYIPYPVISGFMSGIGLIIVITQIFPFIGAVSPSGGAFGTISALHQIPELLNIYSFGAALLTVAIIYGFPYITKKVPATLVALIVVSLLVYFFVPGNLILKLNSNGELPTGLPKLHLDFIPVFTDYKTVVLILEYAFTLAVLGAIDSLLTSVVADNITKTKHNSNKELIGQGIGNIGAGIVGGLPGAGATMRTVINVKSGGKTRLSGVFAGILLTFILLGLGSLVGEIPNAVLAGILLTVGLGIIDYKGLKHIKSVPVSDAVIMIVVLLLTVFVDLLVAVAAGMVLASFVFMKKTADMVEGGSKVISLSDIENLSEEERKIVNSLGDKVYIKHIDGALFFGMIAGFKEFIKSIPEKSEIVIFNMEKVDYVDQSGMYAMEEAVLELKTKGKKVLLYKIKEQPRIMFEKIDIIPDLINEDEIFNNYDEISDYLKNYK